MFLKKESNGGHFTIQFDLRMWNIPVESGNDI